MKKTTIREEKVALFAPPVANCRSLSIFTRIALILKNKGDLLRRTVECIGGVRCYLSSGNLVPVDIRGNIEYSGRLESKYLGREMLGEKHLYIATLGCQMNVYDSQRMAQLLHSYRLTKEITRADLILINTCSVREKAEQKAYSLAGRLRRLKNRKPHIIIGMAGCVAQQKGETLLERFPHLSMVFGTGALERLPDLVSSASQKGERVCDVSFSQNGDNERLFVDPLLPQVKSFVTIMQGCNNFCSYCIVPYVRGRERSRRSETILEEVSKLVDQGVKEVNLLGQNVNSYGKNTPGEVTFPDLLKDIAKISGLKRIRFTTSHPKDLSDELIECFGKIDVLCQHIHLPFQAGSNKVLTLMNRGYTREEYINKVERLRRVSPHVSITSDVIVGFPGEEGKDYQDTLDLMREIEFDSIYSFKYSDRPYARASSFEHKVPENVKNRRLRVLQQLQKEITIKKNRQLEGTEEEILVEGSSKRNACELTGRTGSNRVVNFMGDHDLVGKLVRVKIEKAYANSLRGMIAY